MLPLREGEKAVFLLSERFFPDVGAQNTPIGPLQVPLPQVEASSVSIDHIEMVSEDGIERGVVCVENSFVGLPPRLLRGCRAGS